MVRRSARPSQPQAYCVSSALIAASESSSCIAKLTQSFLNPTASSGGATTARPAASGLLGGGGSLLGGGGSTVQFANTQQPRPAGLMDDDAQDINVAGYANSSDGSMVVRGQQQQLQQQQPALRPVVAISGQAFRPVRRPLNLLALRRPVRRYQAVSSRSGGHLIGASSVLYQSKPRGGREMG